MLLIKDITKFSLQEFPDCVSCIIWFATCNMKCQYCHNPEFVLNSDQKFITKENIIDFLKTRMNLLEAVVFSGGECTNGGNEFTDFVKEVKSMGFKTKIDTNGINYSIIKTLVEEHIVDFVALDFKAPEEKFEFITTNKNYDDFHKSLTFLIDNFNKNEINLEIRTTVHTDLLDENDINKIIKTLEDLGYKGNYYIQNFRNDNKNTLCNLPNQKRLFDKNKVNSNCINIDFRNFF